MYNTLHQHIICLPTQLCDQQGRPAMHDSRATRQLDHENEPNHPETEHLLPPLLVYFLSSVG